MLLPLPPGHYQCSGQMWSFWNSVQSSTSPTVSNQVSSSHGDFFSHYMVTTRGEMKTPALLMTLFPAFVLGQTSQVLNVYVINLQVGSSYTLPGTSSPCPVIAGGVNLTAPNAFTASLNQSSGTCVYTVAGSGTDSINLTLVGASSTSGGAQVVATPTAAPSPGSYSSAQSITLATITSGASIYYTTDGSTPTSLSTLYRSPFTISSSKTVRAIAGESGFSKSGVLTATYIISTSTTTGLSASNTSPSNGSSVTFSATVNPSAASGTVTFQDGAATLGTGTLSSGIATYSTSVLPVGPHTITATYGGDFTYNSSVSSSITVTVTASTHTDTFSSTTPGTALSNNWTQTALTGYVPIVQGGSNNAIAADNSTNGQAIYTSGTFRADQYAQVLFRRYSSGSGLVVRMSASGNGYLWSFGNGRLYRSDFGSLTQVGTCPDASSYNATNDVMKLSVTGIAIVCSDVTRGTSLRSTDPTYTTGYPGVRVSTGSEIGTFTAGSN